MMIEFRCPQPDCGKNLRGPDELAGRGVTCPGCGRVVRVPSPVRPDAVTEDAAARRAAPASGGPSDALVGTTLGHFAISDKLGQGGMGAVYKAHNLRLDRVVALKMLPEPGGEDKHAFAERFLREARLAAQLDHPNIVTVYSVNSESGYRFIEMQYVAGQTLRRTIGGRAIDHDEVIRIIREAAHGLAGAHAKGIIHRDVKPENIMIDGEGRVMMADFGLAKLEESSTGLTVSGQIMGTPLYMSPEQARGEPMDWRSDVYSLGATFFHAVTGSTPFSAETIHGLIYKHIHEPAPEATEVDPSVPEDISTIIRRMMAKDPADRYTSYDDLLADLDAALDRGPLAEGTLRKAMELRRADGRRVRGARWLGGIAAAVVVMALGAVWLYRESLLARPRKTEPAAQKGSEPYRVTASPHGNAPPTPRDVQVGTDPKAPPPTAPQVGGRVGGGAALPVRRKPAAPLTPAISRRGRSFLEDDFSGGELQWNVSGKAAREVVDGALVVRVREGSGVVFVARRIPPLKNVILELEIFLPMDSYAHITCFPAAALHPFIDTQNGRPALLSLRTWANGGPASKVASAPLAYREPRWLRVLFEAMGSTCALTVDGETLTHSVTRPRESVADHVSIRLCKRNGPGTFALAGVKVFEALPKDEGPTEAPKTPGAAPPAAAKANDLGAYLRHMAPVDRLIESADYVSAQGRLNVLKGKYPDQEKVKAANIDRIAAFRKRCFDRVNSGRVSVAMKDLSRRFAFAGPIKRADDKGLTATIHKAWGALNQDEITAFYRSACDRKSAEDLLGLAALLMEGMADGRRVEASLAFVGQARGMGVKDDSLKAYAQMLKKAYAQVGARRPGRAAKPVDDGKPEKKTPSPATRSPVRVYVARAEGGDRIPHPLSRKTKAGRDQGKTIRIPEGMVYIPAGRFLRGRPNSGPHQGKTQKEVYLDAYFIDRYEVTNAQYREFVESTGHPMPPHWRDNGGKIPKGRENHPVVFVTWEDATAYCTWCGKRLPTEAEWEKAAGWDPKTGRARTHPWGCDADPSKCNYVYHLRKGEPTGHKEWLKQWEASAKGKRIIAQGGNTAPVGKFNGDVSAYGCFDMGGNVAEWVSDWFQSDYYYTAPERNPKGPPKEKAIRFNARPCRAFRGGGWRYTIFSTYACYRYHLDPLSCESDVGFRCAADCPWLPSGGSRGAEGGDGPGAAALPKGMVLHLSFDRGTTARLRHSTHTTVKDLSERKNHGVVHGAESVKGVRGEAMAFGGDGDYVDLGNQADWRLSKPGRTFSLWFKAGDNRGEEYNSILRRYAGGDDGAGYVLSILDTGRLAFTARAGKNDLHLAGPEKGHAGGPWTHVAVALDMEKHEGCLYVNGTLASRDTFTGRLLDHDGRLFLGGRSDGRNGFRGAVDELMIFHKALSAEEVQSLYALGGKK